MKVELTEGEFVVVEADGEMEVLILGGSEGVPAAGAKAGDVGIDGAGKDVGKIMTGEIEASDPEVGNREEDVAFGEGG